MSAPAAALPLVSADSHVWTTRLGASFAAPAPRVVVGHGGRAGPVFVCQGFRVPGTAS